MKKAFVIIMAIVFCFSNQLFAQQTKRVYIFQKNSSGDPVGDLRKWEGTEFTQNPFSSGAFFDFPINLPQTIKGDQAVYLNETTAKNEKYNNWNDDKSAVANHHTFTILSTTNDLTSYFGATYSNITIKNNLENFDNINGGYIWFKDPWLIDYSDPVYGSTKRNRGMDIDGNDRLDYKQRVSPFYSNFAVPNGDDYKGVFLSQSYTIPNNSYYSVKVDAVQDIRLYNTGIPGPAGRIHKAYFQGWLEEAGVQFKFPLASETDVMFTQPGATAKANYKVSGLSNNSDAFANGTQRRIVKYNNKLYKVYESEINEINSIWLESSDDNGVTWIIEHNGKPIADNAKCPSLYYFTAPGAPSHLIITYQQDDQRIYVVNYEPTTGSVTSACEGEMLVTDNPNNLPIYPVLAVTWDNSPTAVITYTVNNTIKAFFGLCVSWDVTFLIRTPLSQAVLTTNGTTPALETYSSWFYLVYPNSIYTEMNFKRFHSTDDNTQLIWDEYKLLSERSGYSNHYSPSLVVLDDTYARICWMGTRYEQGPIYVDNPMPPVRRVVSRGQNNDTRFWSFGNEVSPPSINKATGLNQNYYAMAWSRIDNSNTYFADNTLSTTRFMSNVPGKNVQLSNGSTKDQMFAEVFNSNSAPYYFKTSNSIGSYYAPQKQNSYSFASGREGVIAVDTAQFFFTVGDIIADGQPINFITIPDSVSFNSKEILNTYLESEPFQVTDNSTFMYSIQYGITDSSASAALLNNSNKFISFKIELLDKQTSQVLGTYDEVTYNSSNIFQYNNLCYEVSTAGIGNRQVYLRLVVNDNIEPDYSLGELFSSDNVLEKINRISIGYKGLESVTSYDLVQNFPNPFNPSTTISYQIPQNGLVTLKVYDILGSEVATLINEEKLAGKYEVNFNASQLSSGVYIYKIQSGDFVSSKKMILLK